MAAPQAVEMPLDGAGWQDLLRRFLREVHFYDGTGRRAETWPTPLLPLLQEAVPHLDGTRWIVLAPHAGGHLLPWVALAGRAGWAAALATAPALGVLARVLSRPAGERTGALVVGNPLSDLAYAEAEARQVADGLGVSPLLRQRATRAAVLQQLGQAGLAHFATHAYFAPGSPLDSGVVLADGILTAREILERGLRAPEFLALSACQTGMAGALGGDEMAGLSQALVYAGARSLLVSLWAVDDPATAHLMAGFYRRWRADGLDKATALRDAMDATRRDRPEWAHTYYWGAFTLVGDWR
jgi:CHAT domain-containing protein